MRAPPGGSRVPPQTAADTPGVAARSRVERAAGRRRQTLPLGGRPGLAAGPLGSRSACNHPAVRARHVAVATLPELKSPVLSHPPCDLICSDRTFCYNTFALFMICVAIHFMSVCVFT